MNAVPNGRLPWDGTPAHVRADVEGLLGARVIDAATRPGGFSPGVAARLHLDDGRRAFVKSAGPEPNPDTPGLHRAEAIDAPTAAERFGAAFRGWRLLSAGEDLTGLDPWARRNLTRLAALEDAWEEASAGPTLAHADLRADNLLLTADRVVVDWPWACLAAPWFDLVTTLPSIHTQGGPPPAGVFAAHPVARHADDDAVTSVLAALAGYLVRAGRRPPPGLPTLRAFQKAQGDAALDWLRRRMESSP
ncbi:phosphotransferase family protein [Actinomadura sp. 3N407]|uniref:phosphotransferase family protein n=1 Tax=Actinomadura sp. 3N407 TaxID=3457423 RepID=UPI003FCC89C1